MSGFLNQMRTNFQKIKGTLASALRLLTGSRRLYLELEHTKKYVGDIVSHLHSLSSDVANIQSSFEDLREENRGLVLRLDGMSKSLDAIELSFLKAREVKFPDVIKYTNLVEVEKNQWTSVFNLISNHIPQVSADHHVLEVHCGFGKFLFNRQLPTNYKYTGLESSKLMLKGAKDLHQTKNAEFYGFSDGILNGLKNCCDLAVFGNRAGNWSIGELLEDTDRMIASLKADGKLVFILQCDNADRARNVDLLKEKISTRGLAQISIQNCLHQSIELAVVVASKLNH